MLRIFVSYCYRRGEKDTGKGHCVMDIVGGIHSDDDVQVIVRGLEKKMTNDTEVSLVNIITLPIEETEDE